ncbi:hypothetical protein REPUB_Repub13aG0065800 [Reevesia pubescens]
MRFDSSQSREPFGHEVTTTQRRRQPPPQDIETGQPSNLPSPAVALPRVLLLSKNKNVVIVFTKETVGENYDDCAICLGEFQDGDQCRILSNCKHTYHKFCIDRWLAETQNCPICRTSVSV